MVIYHQVLESFPHNSRGKCREKLQVRYVNLSNTITSIISRDSTEYTNLVSDNNFMILRHRNQFIMARTIHSQRAKRYEVSRNMKKHVQI